MNELVLANAKLVLADEVVEGSLRAVDGRIVAAASGTLSMPAAIDAGPGSLGIYVGTPGAIHRVAMVGDHFANGGVIPALALNSVTSVGSQGGLNGC